MTLHYVLIGKNTKNYPNKNIPNKNFPAVLQELQEHLTSMFYVMILSVVGLVPVLVSVWGNLCSKVVLKL